MYSARVFHSVNDVTFGGELMLSAFKSILFAKIEKTESQSRHKTTWHVRIGFAMVAALGITASPVWGQFVIRQDAGTDFLAWEAEDFNSLENADDATGFGLISISDPIVTDFGSMALAVNSNASRGVALFDQDGGSDQDLAHYKLQFAEPGPYFVYIHYTMFEMVDPTNYGNEDSIYFPRDFKISPAGPLGDNNYWAFTPDMGSTPGDGVFEGQYHWWLVENQADGQALQYDPLVGTVLDFSIAARERGASVDKFVMSKNANLTSADLDAIPSFVPEPSGLTLTGLALVATLALMRPQRSSSASSTA